MIAVGSDHGGFRMKAEIVSHLQNKGLEVQDYGTFKGEESVDYPDFSKLVAEAVSQGKAEIGILICGTGIGVSIAANKYTGIRCALCTNSSMAKLAREHNDANILALGERMLGRDLALDIVDSFLEGQFGGGRHAVRVGKILDIEKQNNAGRD